MRRAILNTVVVVILLVSCSGCLKMVRSMYGFKKYHLLTDKEIADEAQHLNIKANEVYKLDSNYRTYLDQFRSEYNLKVENHLEPLQIVFYNKHGVQSSFHTIPYAGASMTNVIWDTNKRFSQYPPRSAVPVDSMFSFMSQLKYINTLDNTPLDSMAYANADYNVVVFWTRFTGRQSKRLVKTVEQNRKLAEKYKTNYLYVNADNMFDRGE